MSQWPLRHILLAATTGILLPLCFPKFDVGLLAWVALIPLHIALDSSRRTQAFWLGWLSGMIGFTGIMSWVVTAMHTYGKVPLLISYGIMLLLTAYLGLFVAVYSAGVVWFRMLVPRYGLFAAPCLWVTLELLRTYLLSGLPWCLFGYSQYRQLDLIQVADHLGVYGVSFLIVLTNVALAELYLWLMPLFRGFRPARLPWELVTTSAMLIGLSWAYSTSVIVSEESERPKATIQVGVVQPNIDQAVKWDQGFREETLRRYDHLTESFGYGTDLIIWPEAATPFVFEREPLYQLQLVAMATRASAPILFGSPAVRFDADRRPYLLNSAYLLSPEGSLLGRYDKQHLVPFGEYIPLKSSALFFLDKLVEGIGDFQAGPGPTILSIQPKMSDESRLQRPVKFGVLICYEVIFPDLVDIWRPPAPNFLSRLRTMPGSATRLLPRSIFRWWCFAQWRITGHLHGLPIPAFPGSSIRSDASSRPRRFLCRPPFKRPSRFGSPQTFYSRYGDVFAYGCVIISAVALSIRPVSHQGGRTGRIAATPV